MAHLINRDPFARCELWRNRTYKIRNDQTCNWCGNTCQTKAGRKYLFTYWTVYDDSNYKTHIPKGLFCSESCRQSFNN